MMKMFTLAALASGALAQTFSQEKDKDIRLRVCLDIDGDGNDSTGAEDGTASNEVDVVLATVKAPASG